MEKRDTIILVPIFDTDKIVSLLREKYDPVAICGIPAHITVLFPFYSPEEITEEIVSQLTELFKNISPIDFSLISISTFPGVVFLEPDPREPFIEITKEIVAEFPDKLPYEGKHREINPHLTIAQLSTKQNFEMIKMEITNMISSKLPIKTRVCEAVLMVEDQNGEWTTRAKFPFEQSK